MKSLSLNLFALVSLVLYSCSSVKVTGEWVNEDRKEKETVQHYDSILITSMLSDQTARRVLEDAVQKELQERGVTASKGYVSFPDMYRDSTPPKKEEIYSKLASGGQGILTISLLNIDTNVQYVPGSVTYAPYPRYDWYGNFWGYYSYYYPRVYEPGYYTVDKVYFVEVNLYDVKSDQLMYSAQTQTVNPNDLNAFADEFAVTIVKKLVKQKLVPEE